MDSEFTTRFKDEIDVLRQARDELRVQLHLGAAEAQDAWEKLEKSWQSLESHLERVGEATRESGKEIEEAGEILIEELKEGYERIRTSLK